MLSTIYQTKNGNNNSQLLSFSEGILQRLFDIEEQDNDRLFNEEPYIEFSLDQTPDSACSFDVGDLFSLHMSRKCSINMSASTQEMTNKDASSIQGSDISENQKKVSFCASETIASREELVGLICKLLDKKPVKLVEIEKLDPESVLIFSNFSSLLYNHEIKGEENLTHQVESLNCLLITTKEKKKRNEERIKYTFKRVNKLLLKNFTTTTSNKEETMENIQQELVVRFFPNSAESVADRNRIGGLLFRPTNLYRNDLKALFSHRLYKEEFCKILETNYMEEFTQKRLSILQGYIKMLKEEIYYAGDSCDSYLLSKKLTRMPWSLQEVQRGVEVLKDILKGF